MSKTILTLRDLHRDYALGDGKSLAVLKGADHDIGQGDFVGRVGPSGSGKTSLLHNAGLIIDGEDFAKADERRRTRARLEKIGFVYQFHHLLPEYTALGNVALPMRILGRSQKDAEARARELLTSLGLAERLDHQPAQLSGGEQQRVAIARALANKPRLLLADEPTGNLDPATSKAVFDALKATVKAQGVGALIATHNLELARHMDRVVKLENGVLVPFVPESA